MSLSDYLKCPGPERSMAATPAIYPCPICGWEIEIWSDERTRRCTACNKIMYNIKHLKKTTAYNAKSDTALNKQRLDLIVQSAKDLGASDAAVIFTSDIRVEDDLAELCDGDPRCENYGLARNCPPHVTGPSGFRALQRQSPYTVAVRLDVPSSALFSAQRREVMGLLHDIVSGVEHTAIAAGFKDAAAFAGGSCKKIFCHNHPKCQKLSELALCRHPDTARPSMSGFGIHVAELIRTAGWNPTIAKQEDAANPEAMSWVAGIIVLTGT